MTSLAHNIEYYTYDQYKEWDGDWELIGGVAYAMSPAPIRRHQSIASVIIAMLHPQLEDCPQCEVLGKIDYKIDESTVVRPDIALVCGETNEYYLTKAPQLIVEIISKSSARRDEVHKFALYEQERVGYYIIIYPDDLRAKIYQLKGSGYEKVGDFSQESYTFEETMCQVALDFKKVFSRFEIKP